METFLDFDTDYNDYIDKLENIKMNSLAIDSILNRLHYFAGGTYQVKVVEYLINRYELKFPSVRKCVNIALLNNAQHILYTLNNLINKFYCKEEIKDLLIKYALTINVACFGYLYSKINTFLKNQEANKKDILNCISINYDIRVLKYYLNRVNINLSYDSKIILYNTLLGKKLNISKDILKRIKILNYYFPFSDVFRVIDLSKSNLSIGHKLKLYDIYYNKDEGVENYKIVKCLNYYYINTFLEKLNKKDYHNIIYQYLFESVYKLKQENESYIINLDKNKFSKTYLGYDKIRDLINIIYHFRVDDKDLIEKFIDGDYLDKFLNTVKLNHKHIFIYKYSNKKNKHIKNIQKFISNVENNMSIIKYYKAYYNIQLNKCKTISSTSLVKC